VFRDSSLYPQPRFAVVNCSDALMSVLYSPVLAWYFCSFQLLCRSAEFIFLRYPHFGALIVHIQCNDTWNKASGCRKICILCEQTSPKRCFGKHDHGVKLWRTNSAHQIQMTAICHWMKPHPWKFSAYATDASVLMLWLMKYSEEVNIICNMNSMYSTV